MSRKKILIANWKLNHNQATSRDFFAHLRDKLPLSPNLTVAVAPVAPMLHHVANLLRDLPLELAAQNVFYEKKGAFTGEWAAEHLKELGVSFCLVGHSERRVLFFETDEVVVKKAAACLKESIIPVICVGESLLERENRETQKIIEHQINVVLAGLGDAMKKPLVFAYEPLWAIGTGKNAHLDQIIEVHQAIRRLLVTKVGEGLAEQSHILYGGSVHAHNIGEMAAHPEIDGALVGGASLQAESFLSMVNALHDIG